MCVDSEVCALPRIFVLVIVISTGPKANAPTSQSTIGIADTGCDTSHPDLRERLWRNPGEICGDGIDNDHNGYVDDCYGWNFIDHNANLVDQKDHGTPVSSAASATTNDGVGIAGICKSDSSSKSAR